MATDRDTQVSGILHEEYVELFDHDAKDPIMGHGESCYRNCKPFDRIESVHSWSTPSGEPITDPEVLERLEAKRIRNKLLEY